MIPWYHNSRQDHYPYSTEAHRQSPAPSRSPALSLSASVWGFKHTCSTLSLKSPLFVHSSVSFILNRVIVLRNKRRSKWGASNCQHKKLQRPFFKLSPHRDPAQLNTHESDHSANHLKHRERHWPMCGKASKKTLKTNTVQILDPESFRTEN